MFVYTSCIDIIFHIILLYNMQHVENPIWTWARNFPFRNSNIHVRLLEPMQLPFADIQTDMSRNLDKVTNRFVKVCPNGERIFFAPTFHILPLNSSL